MHFDHWIANQLNNRGKAIHSAAVNIAITLILSGEKIRTPLSNVSCCIALLWHYMACRTG